MQLADTAALESQRTTRDTSADKKVLRETTQGITKQVALQLATRFSATRLLDMLGRLSPWERLQETDPAIAQWATTLTSEVEWQMRVGSIPPAVPKQRLDTHFVSEITKYETPNENIKNYNVTKN